MGLDLRGFFFDLGVEGRDSSSGTRLLVLNVLDPATFGDVYRVNLSGGRDGCLTLPPVQRYQR